MKNIISSSKRLTAGELARLAQYLKICTEQGEDSLLYFKALDRWDSCPTCSCGDKLPKGFNTYCETCLVTRKKNLRKVYIEMVIRGKNKP